jgi:transcriptional regulator with XRE-family HTH domain
MSFQFRLLRNAKLRRTAVGRRLRAEREKQKKYPEDVAYALGFDRSVLSRIECGRRNLDLIEAENFAVYYGIGLRELETWKKQSDEDDSKNYEGRLENDRILKKQEFLSREEESKEKRKLTRLAKRAARTSPSHHLESPTG